MNAQTTITPFFYQGSLQVPYSKSYLQRAIAVALVSRSKVDIIGYTDSKDAQAARSIAAVLGAQSVRRESVLTVDATSVQHLNEATIHCGEAGLSTRMFSPIAAALSTVAHVQGEGSILVRPMDMVIDALEQLGAKVTSESGKIPLKIEGGIRAGSLQIDASESSQLLTGLLIALAYLPEESTINVTAIKSIPYVQMTLDILKDFGINIRHDAYLKYHFPAKQQWSAPQQYHVEGDWSGASFHCVGAAISGEIRLLGLKEHSSQADSAILSALTACGAKFFWESGDLIVSSKNLNAFEFDATQCPDLFPPLAALAANCQGRSTLLGVTRLTHKESNRALTIQSELQKLGIRVDLGEDTMEIYGGKVKGGIVDSHNDHRIAMMAAILATCVEAPITITNSGAIAKSYPEFFSDLNSISQTKVP